MRRPIARVLLGTGCLAALGAGAICGALGASRLWVRLASSGRMYPVGSVPARDVALVLGAGLRANGTPTPYLAGRLDIARSLYARGAVKAILVSGDNRRDDYNEPQSMYDYLVGKGVPGEQIVRDHAGLDTYDSCRRARDIFGASSLVVVSQSYHLPRALAICHALGLDAVGVGDESGRLSEDTWVAGEQREFFAGVKAAWDVISRRDPALGQVETSLSDAVRHH
ncbi:SanA/YdcF family protein [Austwickia chelonae]|uniref:SanA/YdcF family protein n=1 Tax=Austwickia chelonae TaxID=100225 RepID=UPI000E241F50|nr:ElyC/SanA/YdcF family protein [Austwickia chelonae]